MQAHDRTLPQWFDRIRSRQITLPRFQRFVAWGHGEVADLLTTVLRGLPAGASLILEVGEKEKFKSRSMTDAPAEGERVVEQLLDGQQRLTALWRSLHDKYQDRSYLIGFTVADDNPSLKLPFVYGQARWHKNNARYPVWVDNPQDCWGREMIPVRLLRSGDIQTEIETWIEAAIANQPGDKFAAFKQLSNRINDLRTKVREFNYRNLVKQYPGAEQADSLVLKPDTILYYNGIATIKKKTAFALQNAGGVMIWELLGDADAEKSLLNAVDEVAGAPNPVR